MERAIIKVDSMRELYDYMHQRKSYFSNLICKLVLEAIEQKLPYTVIASVEADDNEDFVYELKVYEKDYIGSLSKNFNGLLEYEEYELAAIAKKIIDENAN